MSDNRPYTVNVAKVFRLKTGTEYWQWSVMRDGREVAKGRSSTEERAYADAGRWIEPSESEKALIDEILGHHK